MRAGSFRMAAASALLLLGCCWLDAQSGRTERASLSLNQQSSGRTFSVKKGSLFEVALPSNPSTGCSLCCLVEGMEPWTLKEAVFRPAPAGVQVPGMGGSTIFTFTADRPGRAVLAFVSVRRSDLKKSLAEASPWTAEITVQN